METAYEFDGPSGRASLLDLFEGRQQLIVYRAFLEPGVHGWPDHACVGCSMVADQVAHVAHLHDRNTTLVFASRAPQADIERVKARMGWEMPWYTMTDGFDVDFGVDEWHGTNAFIRDGDRVFRTYFINSRGDEALGSTWSYLDMTALGRQEDVGGLARGLPAGPAVRAGGRGTTRHRSPARTDPASSSSGSPSRPAGRERRDRPRQRPARRGAPPDAAERRWGVGDPAPHLARGAASLDPAETVTASRAAVRAVMRPR